jgi:ribosomal protein S6--L-glutamate ligase
MNKEIFLTHNRAFQHWDYQIDKLKVAFGNVGYMCRMITPTDMYKEIANNELPYAVIPLIANSSALNSTHLHYIRDLELRGVKHINSITNSMVVDNKMLSHLELKHAGFPVLKTLDLNIDNFQNIKNVISYVNDTIGFPCVIKPVNSHSTIGIHKINDIGHLKEIMSMLSLFALRTFDFASSNINVIIQEYLPTGNEVIRVNVLDGKCLGGLFKVNKTGWRTNPISEGGERHPYELDDKIKELSLSVCRHFKMNFMSLDIFKTDNGYIINELGSMPAIRVFDEMNPNMNVSKLLVDFLLKE